MTTRDEHGAPDDRAGAQDGPAKARNPYVDRGWARSRGDDGSHGLWGSDLLAGHVIFQIPG
ncbi:hypothetical protein QIS74_09329 [Colletotrichum tabaci]|uniref:Uncharacterized protein n=1 Tax=Colletotrichum tabaci TaxID=1209068 RepID=A0AAV9T4A0_9PEZI